MPNHLVGGQPGAGMLKTTQSQSEQDLPGKAGKPARPARLRLWMAVAAALLLGFFIQRFLIRFVTVEGRSMAPSFSEGQVCVVQQRPGELARGDVVIVEDGQGLSIKRVVGLPNESLLFHNGRVYVNGRELREPYLQPASRTYPVYSTRFSLGPNHVFVMGDNRLHSQDSRVYGPLERGAILGKVTP